MPEHNLYIEDQHPASRRFAFFEDDGVSAWLYLTERDSRTPIADVWVHNRIPAPPTREIKSYQGGPPPAAEGYVAMDAMCENSVNYQWSLLWAIDGEAVAIAKDGQAISFITSAEKFGYSRKLIRNGPWGHAWSREQFATAFPEVESP